MHIEKLGPHIGARINGVDLTQPLSHTLIAEIKTAFLEYMVLVFPNQALTPRQLMAFGEMFGEIEPPHPLFPSHPEEPQVTLVFNDEDPPGEQRVAHRCDLEAQTTARKRLACSSLTQYGRRHHVGVYERGLRGPNRHRESPIREPSRRTQHRNIH